MNWRNEMDVNVNFEKRWNECFEGIKESNTKKFGELARWLVKVS